MWIVAQVSFSGRVSMYAGEVRDLTLGEVLDDLLTAGYVVPQETTKLPPETVKTKAAAPAKGKATK